MNKICAILLVLIFSLKNVRNIDDEEVHEEQPVDGDEECESGDLRFPIESISPIEYLKIEKGDNMELECLACGYPRPQIEWLKDDLPPDEWDITADDVDLEFINDKYKLEITELIEDNGGNYTCVLRNNASSINRTFSVSVKRSIFPEEFISKRPQNATVKEGDSHSFKCSVSDPDLLVSWYTHEVNLEPNDIIDDGAELVGEASDELKFTDVSSDDAGWYSCLVTDKKGNTAAASVYLTVIDSPWYSKSWFYFVLVTILLSCLLAGAAFIQFRDVSRRGPFPSSLFKLNLSFEWLDKLFYKLIFVW